MLTQAVKLSPLNLRPVLGIKPDWNAKALGLVASGYARLWAATGNESARREAQRWLAWLEEHHSGDDAGMAWGYHFDVQTRFFSYPRGRANTIATSFVAQAFLDGSELSEGAGKNQRSRRALLEANMLMKRHSASRREARLVTANLLACTVYEPDLPESEAPRLRAQRGSVAYAEGPGRWVTLPYRVRLESLVLCESVTRRSRCIDRGFDCWERERTTGWNASTTSDAFAHSTPATQGDRRLDSSRPV
jgi:hypothetical protein